MNGLDNSTRPAILIGVYADKRCTYKADGTVDCVPVSLVRAQPLGYLYTDELLREELEQKRTHERRK